MDNKGKAIVRRPSSRTGDPVASTERVNALSRIARETPPRSPPSRLEDSSRPQAGVETGTSGDANIQSNPFPGREEFDFVYTSADIETTQRVKARIEYPLVEDLDDELEELERFTRMGNFRAAKAFFSQHLKRHIENPVVFILYAELLLEIGDYNSIIQLEDIAQTAVRNPWDALEDDDSAACSPRTKLYLNWKLIHLIACGRNKHAVNSVLVDHRVLVDPQGPWLSILRSEPFDSTQVITSQAPLTAPDQKFLYFVSLSLQTHPPSPTALAITISLAYQCSLF